MLVVFVQAHIKLDQIEAFKQATLDNASNSINEPGVARFDVFQQIDDPSRFTLVEIYKTEADPPRHRETTHYLRWRDAVASMMVEPRTRTEYKMIFPAPSEP